MTIREYLKENILMADGALGTMLQKYGMETGTLPESIQMERPELLERIYKEYFRAGSDFVMTNTFGANRYKLAGRYTVEEVVEAAAAVARKAVAAEQAARGADSKRPGPWVGLDVAPIGKLMVPAGTLEFEEAVTLFKEQIEAGVKAGVDLIMLETFTDIYELKAALVAAREVTDLPVIASVTFQEDGRMLMGTDPLTAVAILQDLGADVIGLNCSLGPKQMVPLVRQFLKYSKLPVIFQPNAGLPQIDENGNTVFTVGPEEYTETMMQMVGEGVAIVGGCCGTTPDHIAALRNALDEAVKAGPNACGDNCGQRVWPYPGALLGGSLVRPKGLAAVCSGTKTVLLDDGRVHVIGERINPTGKKRLKEALRSGDLAYVENEATAQVAAGAEILDVNVGLPDIDEKAMMLEAVKRVSLLTDAPLQMDSADPAVLEAAVRSYNGKPIINSVNGKQESMDTVLPIAAKYGASIIALTLDERGLPKNAEERVEIAEKIIKEAAKYGIGPERILADCLTLTVSAQQEAGLDTLKAIGMVKEKFGVRTVLGASNVSFGLPRRKLVNRTFLAMALMAGLDAPITDPLEPEYMGTIHAYETLSGKDQGSVDFIDRYAGTTDAPAPAAAGNGAGTAAPGGAGAAAQAAAEGAAAAAPHGSGCPCCTGSTAGAELARIIDGGYVDRAAAAAEALLQSLSPLEIVEQVVIPALGEVGKDIETGKKFLPQLIRSADTVSAAFEVLKKAMAAQGSQICYGKVILATVKGDIHDIGKNIVKVILENYGYQVIDLGKDVAPETIVEVAQKEQVQLVGLSALMTTTVTSMEKTIQALRAAGYTGKVMVGGAVLTATYAEKIGADFFGRDAMEAVRAADAVFRA